MSLSLFFCIGMAADNRYHYLLQSDPDYLSLDDYVLNTGM